MIQPLFQNPSRMKLEMNESGFRASTHCFRQRLIKLVRLEYFGCKEAQGISRLGRVNQDQLLELHSADYCNTIRVSFCDSGCFGVQYEYSQGDVSKHARLYRHTSLLLSPCVTLREKNGVLSPCDSVTPIAINH